MSTVEPTPVAAQSESHACPKCAGKMNFDAVKGMLLCPFCGHTMTVPTAEQQVTIAEHDLAAALKDASGKALGYGTQLKSIKCQKLRRGAERGAEYHVDEVLILRIESGVGAAGRSQSVSA